MVVQKVSSLRQQEAPSCQKSLLGTYGPFLDETFFSQSNWFWSKIQRPLNTVLGEWENSAALLKIETLKSDEENDLKVNCIKQLKVDTITPKIELFFPFLAQVRVYLFVIGGEFSWRMKIVFRFCSNDSSIRRNNTCHHQRTYFLDFVP